jgi:hypothetical protein
MNQARLDLVDSILKCERAAQACGETRSVAALLAFAALQPWYADDLDDLEAAASAGVFGAHAQSLKDPRAPASGNALALSPDAVDGETVIHEITHSALYGIFPLWFEEGFARFVGHYLTHSLDEGVRLYTEHLRLLRRESRLNIGPRPGYNEVDYLAERDQGFLFFKAIYDLKGTEAVVQTIRSLRNKTSSDQELIRTLAQSAGQQHQVQSRQYVCQREVGTTHNYCAP